MECLTKLYSTLSRKIGAMVVAPSSAHIQVGLLLLGVVLLSTGLTSSANAYNAIARYNDDRIAESVDVILTYVHGSFGALVMVSAGIAAILSAAFGGYRAALGLLVVAIGSFIMRSLISTWFNDDSLKSV
jgi:hypothetical protein